MEAGGDWYDVFQLAPTRVGITVGDVVGKGAAAAGVMGRLRSALRALALACVDPNDVIAHLERFAATIDGADFATVCYADLDLESGRLRYLHAGHVPMLLLARDGTASFVEDGRRVPLCVPHADPSSYAELSLEPGTTVVLYSDGLVEGRQRPLSEGLDQLQQLAVSLAAETPEDLARKLADGMTLDIEPNDDIVVLTVRFEGLLVTRSRSATK
jgi:serine phosphatase RsbU (regulator of sigma subunit)